MDKKNHLKHQLRYFDDEFQGMTDYKLEPWQKTYIKRIKKYLLNGNQKNKILIDIAAGSGYGAVEFAKQGLRSIATDISPVSIKNINQAKEKYKLKNLQVIKCRAEKIPLKDNSVDYILANAILEHIPEEKKAIHEWKRILKKNGKIFFTVPIKYKYLWPFFWPVNYLHDKNIGHLRRYDLEDIEEKFGMKAEKVFYTGHFIKVIAAIINKISGSSKFDKYFEKLDEKKQKKAFGSSNIQVILRSR